MLLGGKPSERHTTFATLRRKWLRFFDPFVFFGRGIKLADNFPQGDHDRIDW